MIYKEVKEDFFNTDFTEYAGAHCISLDCKMGAGIAVPIKNKFNLYNLKKLIEDNEVKVPSCYFYNNIFNLITKEHYWNKPTYTTITASLSFMLELALENNINKIVMPKIGSGLDKLNWNKVREIIQELFNDYDIEIKVCYL